MQVDLYNGHKIIIIINKHIYKAHFCMMSQ